MSQYLYFYGKNKNSGQWNYLFSYSRSMFIYQLANQSGAPYGKLSTITKQNWDLIQQNLLEQKNNNEININQIKNNKKDFMNIVSYCNKETIEHIITEIKDCDNLIEELKIEKKEIEDASVIFQIIEEISTNDLEVYWGIEACPPEDEYDYGYDC